MPVTEDPVEHYGDINQDDAVNAADALLALKAAVGKEALIDAQSLSANVNGDARIDAADALLILQRAVGKISHFPVEAN